LRPRHDNGRGCRSITDTTLTPSIFSCLFSYVTSNQNFTERVQALDACPHFHTNWPHNRAGYSMNLLPQASRKSVIFFYCFIFLFHIVVVSMRGAGTFLPYAQEFSASQPVSQTPSKQPGLSSGSDTNFVFFSFAHGTAFTRLEGSRRKIYTGKKFHQFSFHIHRRRR
jgi:hypothetical protein